MNILKNWKIILINNKECINGNVYNSIKFKDGDNINTSPIKSFERDKFGNSFIITFKGSVYELESSTSDIDKSIDFLIKNGILKDSDLENGNL